LRALEDDNSEQETTELTEVKFSVSVPLFPQRPPVQPSGSCAQPSEAAALLIGQRSMKDILPPRALPQRQISGNALARYL